MSKPPRKTWAERQFELFAEAAREHGARVSRDDFTRIFDRLVPPVAVPEYRRDGRPGDGDEANAGEEPACSRDLKKRRS